MSIGTSILSHLFLPGCSTLRRTVAHLLAIKALARERFFATCLCRSARRGRALPVVSGRAPPAGVGNIPRLLVKFDGLKKCRLNRRRRTRTPAEELPEKLHTLGF